MKGEGGRGGGKEGEDGTTIVRTKSIFLLNLIHTHVEIQTVPKVTYC